MNIPQPKWKPIRLLCGNDAIFDRESEMGHRCVKCNAVLGSIGMPAACKELYRIEELVNKLKGNK